MARGKVSTGKFLVGCLRDTVLLVGFLVVIHRLFSSHVPNEVASWALALVCSFFLGSGLAAFWSLARGSGRESNERFAALVRRARSDQSPQGGEPAIVTGIVRALGAVFTAPLSGTPCVGYSYSMYYMTADNDPAPNLGSRVRQVPVYWGWARSAFVLESPVARFRVETPLSMLPTRKMRGKDAIARARQYVEETPFEAPSGSAQLSPGATELRMLSKAWGARAQGGAFLDGLRHGLRDVEEEVGRNRDGRTDRRSAEERDPRGLVLEEAVLPVDREVSVFGTWSSDLGGVTGSIPGRDTCMVFGPPEKLANCGPKELETFRSHLLTACVLTALGAGLLWVGMTWPFK